jgi:hypothetical protein
MLVQIQALHATNASLFAAMRGMVDMEQVRARALEMFHDPVADASAIAHFNAMMGPLPPPEPPADQEEPKARFRVIEGGGRP